MSASPTLPPMDSDRRVALIAGSQHAAKLSINLGMDTARFVESQSEVHKHSALYGIRLIREEMDLLEAQLVGQAADVLAVPLAEVA